MHVFLYFVFCFLVFVVHIVLFCFLFCFAFSGLVSLHSYEPLAHGFWSGVVSASCLCGLEDVSLALLSFA